MQIFTRSGFYRETTEERTNYANFYQFRVFRGNYSEALFLF